MKANNTHGTSAFDRAWPLHADTRRMRGDEVLALRGPCSKTFSLGRGMYQAVIYPEAVHYQEEDGTWEEIDNRIRPAGRKRGALRSGAGPLSASLAETADAQQLVQLQDAVGHSVSWSLEGALPSPGVCVAEKGKPREKDEDKKRGSMNKIGSTVCYADVLPGTDLLCHLHGKHFKDELILKTEDAPERFAFLFDVQALEPREEADGTLTLWEAEQADAPAFTLPPAFLCDAEGRIGPVTTRIERRDDGFRMLLEPDAAFLRTAQYPVVLDPLIKVGSDGALADTYVCSDNPTKNARGENPLYVGPIYGESRAYLKCTSLPMLDSSHTIAKAWMQVVAYPTNDGRQEDAHVYAHEVLGDWDPASINWQNQPEHDVIHLDYATAPKWNVNGQGMTFDLTNLVRKWYAGKNYGVMFDAHGAAYVKLVSSEYAHDKNAHPVLQINYVSHAGLESYLAYESFDVGRAGSAHVALHSGNMVFTRGMTAMNGNRMPISLGLVYNACDIGKDWYGLGDGWRFNWSQHVHRETISGVTYYLYTDEDGTVHAFKKKLDEDFFEDENGLSLKLYEVDDTVEIVSKGHNKLVFGKPTTDFTTQNLSMQMIRRAEDAQGNAASFTFNGRKLVQVTDGAGRTTALSYTASVVTVQPPGYDNPARIELETWPLMVAMTAITDLDGERTRYGYNNTGVLSAIHNDTDGGILHIEYMANWETHPKGKLNRVGRVYELNTQYPYRGNDRAYEYFDCVTRVTDMTVPNGKALTYQFNDYGNVVGVHDEMGYAAFARFTDVGKPNTPEAVSKLQKMVINQLEGHNFEAAGSWITSNESGNAGFIYDDTERLVGRRSLKIVKHDLRGTAYASREVTAKPGTYTFSAFVKSTGDIWSWVEMRYMDVDGVYQTAASQKVRQMGEFTRLSCTLTLPANALSALTCRIMAGDAQGSAWFDCAQLEEGTIANRYSMLYDGNFSAMPLGQPTGWELYYGTASAAAIAKAGAGAPNYLGGNCLQISGTPGAKLRLAQHIDATGKTGDNYVIGGWSNGFSTPLHRPDQETIDKMTPEEKDRLRYYCLQVEFHPVGAAATDYRPGGQADFNEEWVGWQYACAGVAAPVDYDRIRVSIRYENNLNHAQLAAVSLVKELYGPTFAYDEKNNVTAVTTLLEQKSHSEYDDFDNLISYIQPGRDESAKYTITYGETDAEKKKHLPRKATTPLGLVSETVYDSFGNALESKTRKEGQAEFLLSKTAYTADGNYATSVTDARGKRVSTVTDPNKGLVRSVTDPSGQSVTYAYDASNRVTEAKAAVGSEEYKNAYTYEQDRLKTVSHNTTGNTADVTYTFEYDGLGNQTTVKVGNQPLSTNVYTDTGDKLLTRVDYGNGGKVRYTYDGFKRTTGISYDSETKPRFVYEYGANGAVGSVKELNLSNNSEVMRESRISYDTAERPVTAEKLEWGERVYHLLQRYDQFNQPCKLSEEVKQTEELRGLYDTECAYDVESRPTAITYTSAQTKDPELARIGQVKYVPTEGAEKGVLHLKDEVEPQAVLVEYTVPAPPTPLTEEPSQRKLTYEYDGLGRVTGRKLFPTADASTPALRADYGYESGGHGGSSTTGLVGSISVGDRQMVYYYDDVSNIVCENNFHYGALSESQLSFYDHGGNRLPLTFAGQPLITERKCREYEYDKLGQLIRADDGPASESWTYEYDQGGNIVRKLRYAYEGSQLGLLQKGKRGDLLETVEYTYGDPNWKDKLTAYNGKPIEYDAIGNPVKYDGKNFRWKAGRMLSEITNQAGEMIFQFGYDHTGMRTSKWVYSRAMRYTYNGRNLTHMNITGANPAQMHFYHDVQGRPSIIRYNGVDYAYMHNLQGDIIGIVDMDGKAVVEYTYDAWGKPLSKTGVLASTLGTDNPFRYRGYVYDEETGLYYLETRYYNPAWGRFLNADVILGSVSSLLDHNIYSYCKQNPVMRTDAGGTSSYGGALASGEFNGTPIYEKIASGGAGVAYASDAKGTVPVQSKPGTPSKYNAGTLATGTSIVYDATHHGLEYWLRISAEPEKWIQANCVLGKDNRCTICGAPMETPGAFYVRRNPQSQMTHEHEFGQQQCILYRWDMTITYSCTNPNATDHPVVTEFGQTVKSMCEIDKYIDQPEVYKRFIWLQ